MPVYINFVCGHPNCQESVLPASFDYLTETWADMIRSVREAGWKLILDGAKIVEVACPAHHRYSPTDNGICEECQRDLAGEFDEGVCNTGECGCKVARALCWKRWNGDKCLPYSIYDPEFGEA